MSTKSYIERARESGARDGHHNPSPNPFWSSRYDSEKYDSTVEQAAYDSEYEKNRD